jgi:hypothetical protein
MTKLIKILIGIWLLIGATGIIVGGYNLITKGFKDALYFFMLAVVSVVMYFINRRRYKMYIENPQAANKK